MIPAFLLPLALKLSPVGRFLKAIPRPVWIAIGIAAVIGLGWALHAHSVKKAYRTGYSAGVASEGARIARKAEQLVRDAAEISAKARKLNDETNRRIAVDADALRVSGPGKAACLNPATARASGREPPIGQAGPAVDQVPDRERIDLIALPFAEAVALAEEHDLCLAEAETWRNWHKQLEEAWKHQ